MIGRIGAVDWGRRRVGLAVSDALGITVSGLPTLERGADETRDVAATAAALAARDVVRLVVGLPLHADGSESESSAEARRFGDALAALMGLPLLYVDETLTSWEAEEGLKARGRRLDRARRAEEVDRAAAVALLRGYLESLADLSPPSSDPPPPPPAP